MGPLTKDRGQGSLEYVGLAVLVAAVVAALLALPVGDRIVRALDCAVRSVADGGKGSSCEGTGGSDGSGTDGGDDTVMAADDPRQGGKRTGTGGRGASAPGGSGSGTDGRGSGGSSGAGPQRVAGDYPTKGPALESAPANIPVLPFLGRTSVQVEANNRGVSMSADRILSRTKPVTRLARVDRNGDGKPDKVLRDSVTLEVSGTLEVSASVGVDGHRVGANASAGKGIESTYKIKVPPKVADRIAAGKRDAPNPFNPYSIPKGSSAIFTKETYSQLGMETQYRALLVESEIEEGQRVATGVKRVGEHKVRVFTGTADFVRSATSLGVGTDIASIGLMFNDAKSKGKMTSMTFDLSTKAGRQAYRDFIKTGKLPAPDSAGVVGSAKVQRTKWSDKSSIHGSLFDVEIDLPLGSSGMTYTSKLHGNGNRTNSYRYTFNDVTVTTTTRPVRSHYSNKPTLSTGLVLQNVAPEVANAYTKQQGLGNPHYTKPQDMYVKFTAQQLNAIQDEVYKHAARMSRLGIVRGVPRRIDTAAEVERYMDKHPSPSPVGSPFFSGGPPSGVRAAIAHANGPKEVLTNLIRAQGRGNPQTVIRKLQALGRGPNAKPDMPGSIAIVKPSS